LLGFASTLLYVLEPAYAGYSDVCRPSLYLSNSSHYMPVRCMPMRCTPIRYTPTRCTPTRCTLIDARLWRVLRGPSASEHRHTSVPAPGMGSALSHIGFSHRRGEFASSITASTGSLRGEEHIEKASGSPPSKSSSMIELRQELGISISLGLGSLGVHLL
jgi:hypothetical protein